MRALTKPCEKEKRDVEDWKLILENLITEVKDIIEIYYYNKDPKEYLQEKYITREYVECKKIRGTCYDIVWDFYTVGFLEPKYSFYVINRESNEILYPEKFSFDILLKVLEKVSQDGTI